MDFRSFTQELAAHVAKMASGTKRLYVVDLPVETMWGIYLNSFAPGDNNMFRERLEYDCNHCRHFVRDFGNVIAIKNGKIYTPWDFIPTNPKYRPSVAALSAAVKAAAIKDVFITKTINFGCVQSIEDKDGERRTWHHMHASIHKDFLFKGDVSEEAGAAPLRDVRNVFARGMAEITAEAVDQALELIAQNTLYKGEEYKATLMTYKKLMAQYHALPDDRSKEIWCWDAVQPLHESVAKLRGTMIGTFLVDLSEGLDLEAALKKYETKAAPDNYKRPKGVFSAKQLADARKAIENLGYMPSIPRKHAVLDDVSIENTPFADRNVVPRLSGGSSSLDALEARVTTKPKKSIGKVEEISIEKFFSDVLPHISSMEAFVEGDHMQNFVSLIGPQDPNSKPLFKWNNSFCWAYTGNVADSLAERVVAAGGRVDGVLRFTHSWNHIGRNASLMDLHVFMPGSSPHVDGKHDNYPNGQRVGWNMRNDKASGGVQDVDYVSAAPEGYVPVENITFPSLSKLKDGEYVFKIHNWSLRQPTDSGVKCEIAFGGQVFTYEIARPLGQKEWVTVAVATLKNGRFTIEHKIPHGTSSKPVWGIKLNQFHPVTVCMQSPNFWDKEHGTGHRHFFFMLKDCINDESPNGFFNEYLCSDLEKHRQVFEALGAKESVKVVDDQLSGIGFSATKRATLTVKVSGSFNRTLKILF